MSDPTLNSEASQPSIEAVLKLAACPFCKWEELHVVLDAGNTSAEDQARVVCHECGMCGPPSPTIAEAVALWNEALHESCEHCGCLVFPKDAPTLCETCVGVCNDDCDHLYEEAPAAAFERVQEAPPAEPAKGEDAACDDDELTIADLRAQVTSLYETQNVMQDDIAAMLRAAGLSDHARDQSPHSVVVDTLMPRIAELKSAERSEEATYDDANRVIRDLEARVTELQAANTREVETRRGATARAEKFAKALREVIALEPEPYVMPPDWREQIAACKECKRWADHPIQLGICDEHRRPLWAREKHDDNEARAIGGRARTIARNALTAALADAQKGPTA